MAAKKDGYTSAQRFYIGLCAELVRELASGAGEDAGVDGSSLAGSLPREWSDCESAWICGGVWLQEGRADGAGEELPRLVVAWLRDDGGGRLRLSLPFAF